MKLAFRSVHVLSMKRAAAKIVPKLLNANDDPDVHKKVITSDESFLIFPKLKTPMKGKGFATIEDIK